MNILIEGPDGSGKTTLAKMLNTLTGFRVLPSVGPVNATDPEARQLLAIERKKWYLALNGLDNLIIDRSFFISEYIYGKIFRNHSYVSFKELTDYILELTDNGDAIIFCTHLYNHEEETRKDTKLEKMATERQKEVATFYETLRETLALDWYGKYFEV